ncbi:tripartite tricarboxylate transporter substrate-binding protein [Pseudarthrobacter sp. H3Y2-7]|uniref:Bug family tripartite tricarboxylate transporter substrate binding protein n=1 Tax=Pseudarthrobacter naphthalenicus TaxID=3031328 RepID=UPI0023B1EF36|nr:tripartite tricarboxylate transporter substrate-binding protein [Pseudarthrobacter sp. H3Y2-7]MDE8670499.1 tripartite tricarboxylate transporter substrate-binding protein [Pseudarthrobacter sp. H3Y2-7]
MRKLALGLAALALAGGALTGCSSAGATGASTSPEDAAAKLKNQTITLVVPFDPGGGYDAYARMLAPKLADELGATVIVENKPGAGGILATNESVHAKPDGKTLVLLNGPGHLGAAIAKTNGVRYDAKTMSYIGQISSEPDVLATSKSSSIASVDDISGKRFAATGPGSNEYIDAVVLNQLLGMDNQVVTGFKSSNEASLNVIQGNVELHSRSFGSQQPGINAGDLKPILVIGENTGEKEIKDVDNLLDVVKGDQKELATLHTKLISSGRLLAAPPGMDPGTLQTIRDAFEKVMTDKAFIKAAADTKRPVHYTSGDDVQKLVNDVMGSPQEYVDLITKAYTG